MSHSVYNITVLKHRCVLTEYNTLYKFVTTQRDDLCQKLVCFIYTTYSPQKKTEL